MYTKSMIRIIRKYNFTAKDFFDYLEQTLTKEIKKARKNNLSINIQRGTIYSLKGKDGYLTNVVINEFTRNKKYSSTFENHGQRVTVTYTAIDIKDGCELILTEDLLSYNPKQHNQIVNFLNNFLNYRSAQQKLNVLAQDVKKNIASTNKKQ